MSTERTRIAVVGAGSVGSTIAFAVMLRGLAHEMVLVDAMPRKAEAEAKDLMHGSMFVPRAEVTSGTLEDSRGSAVVVVTAGAKQQPGQTRLQLVETNAALFRELVPRILSAAWWSPIRWMY
jgi:L-lactate dehydrogenase